MLALILALILVIILALMLALMLVIILSDVSAYVHHLYLYLHIYTCTHIRTLATYQRTCIPCLPLLILTYTYTYLHLLMHPLLTLTYAHTYTRSWTYVYMHIYSPWATDQRKDFETDQCKCTTYWCVLIGTLALAHSTLLVPHLVYTEGGGGSHRRS